MRQHVVTHTVGAAGLFVFLNSYYSILLWLCSDKLRRGLFWFRTLLILCCWFCLLGIIICRSIFIYRGGYDGKDPLEEREAKLTLIFWANLYEWIWVGLGLLLLWYTCYYDEIHVYEGVKHMRITMRLDHAKKYGVV